MSDHNMFSLEQMLLLHRFAEQRMGAASMGGGDPTQHLQQIL